MVTSLIDCPKMGHVTITFKKYLNHFQECEKEKKNLSVPLHNYMKYYKFLVNVPFITSKLELNI